VDLEIPFLVLALDVLFFAILVFVTLIAYVAIFALTVCYYI
jgi:hypothetical protein